jgi:hypothetical protein
MKKEKTSLLSAKAKEILTELRIHKGSFLQKHINHNGEECWKLLDEKMNPLAIYTDNKVQKCLEAGFLIRIENGLSFNHNKR